MPELPPIAERRLAAPAAIGSATGLMSFIAMTVYYYLSQSEITIDEPILIAVPAGALLGALWSRESLVASVGFCWMVQIAAVISASILTKSPLGILVIFFLVPGWLTLLVIGLVVSETLILLRKAPNRPSAGG